MNTISIYTCTSIYMTWRLLGYISQIHIYQCVMHTMLSDLIETKANEHGQFFFSFFRLPCIHYVFHYICFEYVKPDKIRSEVGTY